MAFIVPFIPMIIGAVGTVMSYSSSMNKAKSAEAAGQYNAGVARQNAAAALAKGKANADAQARKSRLAIGAARAGYGASGVTLEGSPIDILAQSAMNAEIDRQNILYGSQTEADAYEAQAGMALWKGSQEASAAKSEARMGILKSGMSMFGGMMGGSSGGGGGGFTGGATGGGSDATLNRMN